MTETNYRINNNDVFKSESEPVQSVNKIYRRQLNDKGDVVLNEVMTGLDSGQMFLARVFQRLSCILHITGKKYMLDCSLLLTLCARLFSIKVCFFFCI